MTPPDAGWTGAQWKANTFTPDEIERRHLKCSSSPAVCRPPYFGWVAIAKGGASPAPAPQALILIMTGYSRTPTVATTVANLRTRGHGATYGPATMVKVAGFTGTRFDGRLVGPKHVFVPFSATTRMSGLDADGRQIRKGAADAVKRWVADQGGSLPGELDQIVERVARAGSTPLVVSDGLLRRRNFAGGKRREGSARGDRVDRAADPPHRHCRQP